MTRRRRLAAAAGIAAVRLKRSPSRTVLAVIGIAVAVLAVTVLASIGAGVLETGQQKFDASGRDLWVTGGPLELQPRSSTPLENAVVNSHDLAADLEGHPNVAVATPMAFQAVYVGRNASDLKLITGAGVPKAAGGKAISISRGRGLTGGDAHYANGTYEGPMSHQVVIDPRTAKLLDASLGDALYVGGSRATASEHEFTIVGVSSTFSRFLGTPTVVFHLSELQEVAGTTGADRATFVTVRLTESANLGAMERKLQEAYPAYDVRTNRQQLRTIVRSQSLLIASAGALVGLAILAGVGLTVNLLALVVYQQRRELAALRAMGLSRGTLVTVVGTQGVLLGVAGGGLGLVATPLAVGGLNRIAAELIGFETLMRTTPMIYGAGVGIAVGIGALGAVVGGWHVGRLPPMSELER